MNARGGFGDFGLASLFCLVGGAFTLVAAGESNSPGAPSDGSLDVPCQVVELVHCTSGCREAGYYFSTPATLAIPSEIPVVGGNAGQGFAEMQFTSAATGVVTTCTYQGAAQLLASAAGRTQLLVTTHSDGLARLVQKLSAAKRIRLEKIDGETRVTTEPDAKAADQGA